MKYKYPSDSYNKIRYLFFKNSMKNVNMYYNNNIILNVYNNHLMKDSCIL